MKRVITGAAIVASLFLLAGCGNNESKSSQESSSSASSKTSALATAQMDVDATFTDKTYTKLVPNVTSADLKSLTKEVGKLPASKAKNQMLDHIKKAADLVYKSTVSSAKTEYKKQTQFKLEDGDKAYVKSGQKYIPNTVDSSWAGSTFKITHAYIMKTSAFNYSGDESDIVAHGLIELDYSYKAGSTDLDPMLDQATISTDSGTQADVDSFDSNTPDGIDSGVTKKGFLYFPMETMDKATDIHSIRLKFTCYPQDDDSDDSKDYDITIPLNN